MEEEQLFTTVTIINDIDIDKNDKNEILLNTECTAIILERYKGSRSLLCLLPNSGMTYELLLTNHNTRSSNEIDIGTADADAHNDADEVKEDREEFIIKKHFDHGPFASGETQIIMTQSDFDNIIIAQESSSSHGDHGMSTIPNNISSSGRNITTTTPTTTPTTTAQSFQLLQFTTAPSTSSSSLSKTTTIDSINNNIHRNNVNRNNVNNNNVNNNANNAAKPRMIGTESILVVRVIASNANTTLSEQELSDNIFGTGNDAVNLKSQYAACSHDQLLIEPTPDQSYYTTIETETDHQQHNIINGVTTVHVNVNTSEGDTIMRNAITRALNYNFSVNSPTLLANRVMYCLPANTIEDDGIAYAFLNSWLSVYSNNWCTSMSTQVHELGHNFDLAHSNENGEYLDQSGMMGSSYASDDTPLMCFNAAKSWQLGWYSSKHVTIDNMSTGSSSMYNYVGELAGLMEDINDPNVPPMIIKLNTPYDEDYYIYFNRQFGFNAGTQEGGNQVLMVIQGGEGIGASQSELVARFSAGESGSFEDIIGEGSDIITVSVDSIGTRAHVHVQMCPVDADCSIAPTPSTFPSFVPSDVPSDVPTRDSTVNLTLYPSMIPSDVPMRLPTLTPTLLSSMNPSTQPSIQPIQPSFALTSYPSIFPTISQNPTQSQSPSIQPTASQHPTIQPTASQHPTMAPSSIPSEFPTLYPSWIPSSSPTNIPSISPSRIPSRMPSITPTRSPSSTPSSAPSSQPSIPSLSPYYRRPIGIVVILCASVTSAYISYLITNIWSSQKKMWLRFDWEKTNWSLQKQMWFGAGWEKTKTVT